MTVIFEGYLITEKSDRALQRQAIIISRLEEIISSLGILSDNENLIALVNKYIDANNTELKNLMRILIEIYTKNDEPLSQHFVDVSLKLAKLQKCSSILASFINTLPFDIVKEHLPLMII